MYITFSYKHFTPTGLFFFRKQQLELDAQCRHRSDRWVLQIMKYLCLCIHRLLAYLKNLPTAAAHRNDPLLSMICLPVCSDDRGAREIPAFAEIVIEEGLQEHLVNIRFVIVICTGKRPYIVCKRAEDHGSLYSKNNSVRSGAPLVLTKNIICCRGKL